MKSIRHLSLITLALFLWLPVSQAQSVLPDNFETFIEEGLAQWDIPGIAIGIVKDGEVVYTNGFGVRKLGEPEPVNENTQFGIASVSKHMTASSLAILVDEGKLSWDDPVQKHIPWFKLSDPWASENVTIKDILTHQVGVGRILGNRLQFMTDRSRDELLYQMRYHDFEQPFRSAYVYSNVMYTLAGEVVKAITGQSWDEFMAERFFEPLGMTRTNTSINDLHEDGNAAWPHQYIKGEVVTIDRRSWDIASPAGGVNSTPVDMGKWMLMQLGTPGSYQEKTLISEQRMRDIQTPQVSQNIGAVDSPLRGYGLGYGITDYQGYRVLSHGGATDGMNTTYMLLPEIDFGIIIMTNVFTTFREAIAYKVIDHLLGIDGPDWNQRYFDGYTNQYNRVKQIRQEFEATRIPSTRPTHSLRSYTGAFHNDLYDNAEIKLEGGGLVISLWDDTFKGDLEHWHHNTFRINWRNPAQREEFIKFDMNLEGQINEMTIRFALRPMLLQVGAYPTNYYRDVTYIKVEREP
jgi:CubicO group peptidase (beta-lactamase class C family)